MVDLYIASIWLVAICAALLAAGLLHRIFIVPFRRESPRPGRAWNGQFTKEGIRRGYVLRKHKNMLLPKPDEKEA